jgi:hypothetical protein
MQEKQSWMKPEEELLAFPRFLPYLHCTAVYCTVFCLLVKKKKHNIHKETLKVKVRNWPKE